MFFGQSTQHIEILKQSNPRVSLPRFQGPVLFINGSKDHHDSDEVWAGLLGRSRRLVYEGGDHFFSHDDRFADRLVQDTLDFLHQELLGAQGGYEASANSL
jgi:pimeloyl-ACP methyl ester carboxylesterase